MLRWMKRAYRFFGHLLELGIRGGAEEPHDVEKLVVVIPAAKKGGAGNHFGEDTPTGPDVDGGAVCSGAEEDVRGAIPESDDLIYAHTCGFNCGGVADSHYLVGEGVDGYTKCTS